MTIDSEPSRRTETWARIGVVLALVAVDGVLALALLYAIGVERISAQGFHGGLVTRTEFSVWIVIFAVWALLTLVPVVAGPTRGRVEVVAVQVLVGVTVLALWAPTLRAGWHDLHVSPVESTPSVQSPTHACTGHGGNSCPGG